MREEMLDAVRRMILETNSFQAVAAALREGRGWHCTQRGAEARLSHMLSPDDAHCFPAEELPVVIALTGRDDVTPILLRASLGLFEVRVQEKGKSG